VIVIQARQDQLCWAPVIVFAFTPFPEGWRLPEPVGDGFSNALSDSTLVIEARSVTGHPEHHRLSGRKNLLPGQAACLPSEFGKGGGVKYPESDQHPACSAQMEIGAIEITEGSSAFHPARILAGIVEVGRIRGGKSKMARRHSQLPQFSFCDTLKPGRANDKKGVHAVSTAHGKRFHDASSKDYSPPTD
jgi:hypothetical protein